jgi:hypothetical protein
MDRRMGGEVPGPGVEDAHHAEWAAEVVGVQSQCLQGGSGGLQEQGGETVLVRTGHRAQCLGQRQGDQTVRDRQEQCPLLFQPACGRGMLTRGAMPVRTRMRALLQLPAGGTRGEMPPQSLGAARFNRLHGRQVAGEHAVCALRPVGRAMASEDRGQLDHGGPPAPLRGRPEGLPGPHGLWRRWWRSGAWRGPSWLVSRALKSPGEGADGRQRPADGWHRCGAACGRRRA